MGAGRRPGLQEHERRFGRRDADVRVRCVAVRGRGPEARRLRELLCVAGKVLHENELVDLRDERSEALVELRRRAVRDDDRRDWLHSGSR